MTLYGKNNIMYQKEDDSMENLERESFEKKAPKPGRYAIVCWRSRLNSAVETMATYFVDL